MTNTEKILQLAKNNNGIVTTQMASDADIARTFLKNLLESGKLEKIGRGIYALPEAWEDEFLNYQLQFKKGIYDKETALFLHGMTDKTPLFFSMNFPESYNVSRAKAIGIDASRSKLSYYNLGVETIKSPYAHDIMVYNQEKTLCDIVRTKSKVDIGIVSQAFKAYVGNSILNIPKLSEYAKLLKVEDKVRTYLEVLL